MKKYPVALNIKGWPVLIVGGGEVALRKASGLQNTGAHLTVVAPKILPDLYQLAEITVQRQFTWSDLNNQRLVFCATDDPVLNRDIMARADKAQLVNNTADRHHSDFYNFASFNADGLDIHIGSNGENISKVQAVKRALIDWFNSQKQS